MKLNRTGIILYTINYQKCVAFYQRVLELSIMFKTDTLTCFQLGASYLMVEIDDEVSSTPNERIRTCIRMNVLDVRVATDDLIKKNIEVDYQEHSWGTIAKFFDPDGNLCSFKDSEKFERQINEYHEH
jgi:lactoylglutathione lyase